MQFENRVVCNYTFTNNGDICTIKFSGPFNLSRSFYNKQDLEDYLIFKDMNCNTKFVNDILFMQDRPEGSILSIYDSISATIIKEQILDQFNNISNTLLSTGTDSDDEPQR